MNRRLNILLPQLLCVSEEQPIIGISEIPEVEGDADQGAEAPVEEVGPVAAPQLEDVIAQDEVVINDIVLKPTSSSSSKVSWSESSW